MRNLLTVPSCSCFPGYFEYNNALNCLVCKSTCKTCVTAFSTCQSCHSSQNRVLSGTTCICADGWYEKLPSGSTDICPQCLYPCRTCVNYANTCTSCPPGSFRNSSNLYCACLDGYYDNGVPICP